ncbi:MAG: hypothetical protein RL885_24370 [Planctomycetota bacterium]
MSDRSMTIRLALLTAWTLSWGPVSSSVLAQEEPSQGQSPVSEEADAKAASSDEPEAHEAAETPPPMTLDCRIAYSLASGVFVDIGVEVGLRTGVAGWLRFRGERLVRFEVGAVTRRSTFLQFLGPRPKGFPGNGVMVTLELDEAVAPQPEVAAPLEPLPEDSFRPLLVTPDDVDVGEPENVFHGRLTFRQIVQGVSDGRLDYLRSEVRTFGSLERIEGTPWAIEWAGDFTYRDGDALQNVKNYREIRSEIERFVLARRFDDESILRLGRFIPGELPSIGYLDGAHLQKVFSKGFHWGVLGGWKPTRQGLHPTSREPTGATYLTYFTESEDGEHYSVTGGVLVSQFEGDLDRVALLIDQTARFGVFDLYASSEVDFDVNAAETRDGTRLSRLDLGMSARLEGWSPRAGVSHYEILDTATERDELDLLILTPDEFLEDSYWRGYVGASHDLSDEVTLDEEISYWNSETTDDGIRWRASLSKRNFFGSQGARGTLSVFNLLGEEQRGYGGRLSAYFPNSDGSFSFEPAMSFRYIDYQEGRSTFDFTDLTLRTRWRPGPNWELFATGAYSLASDVQRLFLEIGVTFRW